MFNYFSIYKAENINSFSINIFALYVCTRGMFGMDVVGELFRTAQNG